ncbi:hypothetical protein [Desertivirga brevis]|uniref:hypothetical protein n=1 Tax=Desertivirga brevis TaxID=2810310 RepID=UPI001A957579|nr:hypothetical protein [Pedobacter sp. SYSU D00873]
MKIYNVKINDQLFTIEQPSSDYNIFYVNRKNGTCCIAKDKDKNWIIEAQYNPSVNIPVEQIGRYLDETLLN